MTTERTPWVFFEIDGMQLDMKLIGNGLFRQLVELQVIVF